MAISPLTVKKSNTLLNIVKSEKVERILLATPSVTRMRQREIVESLSHLNCEIQTLPSDTRQISGDGSAKGLQPAQMEGILGRGWPHINLSGVIKQWMKSLVQDIQICSKTTQFSMVFFGNVHGFCEVLISLFHDQMTNGGNLDVTACMRPYKKPYEALQTACRVRFNYGDMAC